MYQFSLSLSLNINSCYILQFPPDTSPPPPPPKFMTPSIHKTNVCVPTLPATSPLYCINIHYSLCIVASTGMPYLCSLPQKHCTVHPPRTYILHVRTCTCKCIHRNAVLEYSVRFHCYDPVGFWCWKVHMDRKA